MSWLAEACLVALTNRLSLVALGGTCATVSMFMSSRLDSFSYVVVGFVFFWLSFLSVL
jgi:hypothetical protein